MLGFGLMSRGKGAVLGTALLTGCTGFNGDIGIFPSDPASLTVHHYNAAMSCARPIISKFLRNGDQRLLFFFDELGDLTRNPRDHLSGPLSYGGATVMRSLMRSYTPNSYVLMPFTQPEEVSLFFAGRPLGWGEIQGLKRRYNARRILGIKGGFTSFDQARSLEGKGVGFNARQNNYDVRLEAARSNEGGRINLVLEIGDVASNRMIGTVRLTGSARRRSTSFRGTLEIDGFGGGFSSNDVEIDGVHNVQENLIAAAHFYLWAALIPGSEELDCLYSQTTSPASIAERVKIYEDATRLERRRMLQRALNAFHGTDHPAISVDGVIGPDTRDSIRAAERKLRVLPHGSGDYGVLYIRLLQSGVYS